MCGMTFLNGFKGYFYLIYIVPIYDAVLAAWLLNLWARSRRDKWGGLRDHGTFAILQLSTSIQHILALMIITANDQPAIRDLKQYRSAGKSIVGTAALGFGLNFSGFKDDIRAGTYSGLNAIRFGGLTVRRAKFAGMFEKTNRACSRIS